MDILIGILEQGFIYAIIALGVYITYKILDFPDLTVDGSFPLGAAITVIMIKVGVHPVLTLLASFLAGVIAGCVTGLIHVKGHVRDLLSGIITMTALYSINLHIAGKANVSLLGMNTIFNNGFTNRIFSSIDAYKTVIIIFFVLIISKLLLDWYLTTRSGYLLRATGDNATLVTSLAKDSGTVKILGLALANGLAALGGSVMCQQQRFFDISMGTGTIVIGLATVIIGTNLFQRVHFVKATTAVILGSVIYKACVSIAISCGLQAIDMKLITAVLFLVILIFGTQKKRKAKKA